MVTGSVLSLSCTPQHVPWTRDHQSCARHFSHKWSYGAFSCFPSGTAWELSRVWAMTPPGNRLLDSSKKAPRPDQRETGPEPVSRSQMEPNTNLLVFTWPPF